jgi:Tfp pilus assembly protein PilX
MKRHTRRDAAALAIALAALLAVTLVAAALVQSMLAAHRQAKRYHTQLQTQWLAEAGIARAQAQLRRHSEYAGETWQPAIQSETGDVTIRIDPASDSAPRRLVVEAVYPPHEAERILVRRERLIP